MIDKFLSHPLPAGGDNVAGDRLLPVGVGHNLQPLAGVDVGHHRVEETGQRAFGLREERPGRERKLITALGFPHPLMDEVAVVDLPYSLVQEMASQGQPQRNQRGYGQQANLESVLAQGTPPKESLPTLTRRYPL